MAEQSIDGSTKFQWQSLSFQTVPRKHEALFAAAAKKRNDDSYFERQYERKYSGYPSSSNIEYSIHTLLTPSSYEYRFKNRMFQKFDSSKVTGCKFLRLNLIDHGIPNLYWSVTETYMWEDYKSQVNRCLTNIREASTDRRIFLVCWASFAKEILPEIHDLPQLYAVYVHCGITMHHDEWTKSYWKVRIVFEDEREHLIPQLAVDVAQTNLEWAIDLLEKGAKTKAKKKLQLASNNLAHCVKENPQPGLEKEIRKKLEECQ